jgi:hypothetical protein
LHQHRPPVTAGLPTTVGLLIDLFVDLPATADLLITVDLVTVNFHEG